MQITTKTTERKNGGAPYINTDVWAGADYLGFVNRDKRPFAKCRAMTACGRREVFSNMDEAIRFLREAA